MVSQWLGDCSCVELLPATSNNSLSSPECSPWRPRPWLLPGTSPSCTHFIGEEAKSTEGLGLPQGQMTGVWKPLGAWPREPGSSMEPLPLSAREWRGGSSGDPSGARWRSTAGLFDRRAPPPGRPLPAGKWPYLPARSRPAGSGTRRSSGAWRPDLLQRCSPTAPRRGLAPRLATATSRVPSSEADH